MPSDIDNRIFFLQEFPPVMGPPKMTVLTFPRGAMSPTRSLLRRFEICCLNGSFLINLFRCLSLLLVFWSSRELVIDISLFAFNSQEEHSLIWSYATLNRLKKPRDGLMPLLVPQKKTSWFSFCFYSLQVAVSILGGVGLDRYESKIIVPVPHSFIPSHRGNLT